MILLNNTGQKQNDTSHDETETHLINLVNESWKNTTEMYLYDCLCKRKNQKMILVIKDYKRRREKQTCIEKLLWEKFCNFVTDRER